VRGGAYPKELERGSGRGGPVAPKKKRKRYSLENSSRAGDDVPPMKKVPNVRNPANFGREVSAWARARGGRKKPLTGGKQKEIGPAGGKKSQECIRGGNEGNCDRA